MKHLGWLVGIATSAIIATTSSAHAQAEHYDPIRFDSGLTGSYVNASGRGGFGALVEGKFLAHDNIGIGLRLEAEAMFGGNVGSDGSVQMDLGAVAAMLAKGEYYVGTGPVRPFVGLALGVYDIASQSISAGSQSTGVNQTAGRYFGVAPQVGLDLGRLRLAATYNAILGADIEVTQMIGTPSEQKVSFSQNYLSFEMSIRFGGGRKRAPMAPVILVPVPGSMPPPAPPAPPAPMPPPPPPAGA